MRNYRADVFVNGDWCRITLAPGTRHIVENYDDSEEGYSFDREIFENTGEWFLRYVYHEARDCDGLHCHESWFKAPLETGEEQRINDREYELLTVLGY